MKHRKTALRSLICGVLWGTLSGTPVLGDDTEIYVGLSPTQSAAKPNVLFVIDTSGSMGAAVTVTSKYDPAVTYSGSCPSGRIYWSSGSGSTPSCGTSQYFDESRFRCEAATASLDLNGLGTGPGFFQDRMARWRDSSGTRRDQWRSLSSSVQSPPHVECKADSGAHGNNAGDVEVYAANRGHGPWSSSAAQGVNWNRTGGFYTLYNANYLNWFHNYSVVSSSTRIQVVKDVAKDLIDANNGLNIGLMRFDTHNYGGSSQNRGGPVIFALTDIDQPGVKTSFNAAVDSLNASGYTPLAETMYEALHYYQGQDVHFGKSPNDIASVAGSHDGGTPPSYDSPMAFQCQKNFIVYLTDGDPTYDSDADPEIKNLLSGATGLTLGSCGHGGGYSAVDNCLDELAEYMLEIDQATPALGNDLPGKQNIITYTVGFATNQQLLNSAATKGGGSYYVANDAQELGEAFTEIVAEVMSVNSTFTAPAVSVNAFNRITHRNELYFTLFKPSLTTHWDGNIKRFELDYVRDQNGDPVDQDNDGLPDPPEILDVYGVPAVDANTGFFRADVTSFWTPGSDAPDGDETAKGGAASKLPEIAANRRVYTDTGATQYLTDPTNSLHEVNVGITDAMLGLTGAAGEPTRDTLLKWARGVDTEDDDEDGLTTDGRHRMGDPLHARPVLVTYGGTQANPDIALFAITNDGYFHAVNTTDGTEYFSFVPSDLLPNLKDIYQNTAGATLSHTYGLDGGIET